ncbi:NRDE family protein [Alkalimonas amylolytica]|uniref:Transport and Golgi organisation 2 n=1 Tax=Alkalimonas amylolytica TaxID=152573 RepID=A0A1H3XRW1_ALKAM|nr:NRDE family protein [Alkalimonas amylolytica]SEA02149.1 Transport and Golgi organisation 2 [Alkalimonas amylolytica]
MCTLSWWYQQGQLHILFNRDERKIRARAHAPQRFSQQGVDAIMPIDPDGGGSWVAANEQGWVFCLLNDYAAAYQPDAAIRRSRGLLLRALAHSSDWQVLDALLQPEQLRCYAPFRLLLFVGQQEPLLWHWDGSQLRQQLAPTSPLSSSSALPGVIPRLRAWHWQRGMARSPSLQTQQQLHRQPGPFSAFSGIAMQRSQVQTVSITQLTIEAGKISMQYWDGHPSTHQADASHCLELPLKQPAVSEDYFSSRLDVQALLSRYNPTLASQLKGWQWALLRWLLAEKALNQGLELLNRLPVERFCDVALQRLQLTPDVIACRWPAAADRPVFVCNHPTGGIDGLLLISVLQKRYPNLQVLANEALTEVQQLARRIVPIPVFARPKDALPAVQAAFASDAPLLIFPAGRTARKSATGTLDDGAWAKLAVTLARRQQRSLTVLHLQHHNSRWFYSLAWLRNQLGMTANLEMLLLVREMLKPANRTPRLYVDIPMHAVELDALADSDLQRIAWLKRRCYQLPTIYQEAPDAAVKPSCSRRAG